jgi:putative transcriptional regulator
MRKEGGYEEDQHWYGPDRGDETCPAARARNRRPGAGWPKPIDIKAIRKRVKMSQAEFSRAYGISKRALQEWEQGGRQPDSAARAYLTVIAKEPSVVRRALGRE